MGDFKLQHESKSEKYRACWDEVNKCWFKVFIERIDKPPQDVIEQIKKDKEKLSLINEIDLEGEE